MSKTDINNDNKTAFTACYWGQNVLVNSYNEKMYRVGSQISEHESVFDKYHLSLKPLSSISEEHALEVARICGMHNPEINFKNKGYIEIINNRYELVIFFDGRLVLTVGGGKLGVNPGAFDFLRANSYLIGFRDLSPEEIISAGWVVLREEGKE